jgi:hypothetical protein
MRCQQVTALQTMAVGEFVDQVDRAGAVRSEISTARF